MTTQGGGVGEPGGPQHRLRETPEPPSLAFKMGVIVLHTSLGCCRPKKVTDVNERWRALYRMGGDHHEELPPAQSCPHPSPLPGQPWLLRAQNRQQMAATQGRRADGR